MLTLEEKLRSTHRYATLNDFHLGLEYEEVQPSNGGKKHGFVKRKVRPENFSTQAREFVILINNMNAIIPVEDVPSEEYEKAATQIMADDEIKKLLASYPDKEKQEPKKEIEQPAKTKTKPKKKA